MAGPLSREAVASLSLPLPHHLHLVSVGTPLILCRKGPALKQGDPHTEVFPPFTTLNGELQLSQSYSNSLYN